MAISLSPGRRFFFTTQDVKMLLKPLNGFLQGHYLICQASFVRLRRETSFEGLQNLKDKLFSGYNKTAARQTHADQTF